VYDVSNRESFEALPRWFTELDSYVSEYVVKIVVANKLDKESNRQVTAEEGRSFADKMGTHFVEASAKTDVGVQEAFREVVEKILDTPELWSAPGKANTKSPTKAAKMPGGVSLSSGASDTGESSGCSC